MLIKNYFKPDTICKAVELLNKYKKDAEILAGGTDLTVRLKKEKREKTIIDIKNISELNQIKIENDKYIEIGSIVTIDNIESYFDKADGYKALSNACSYLGSKQIRNRATIGGNICNASPAADTIGPLLCLDAVLRFESIDGERDVKIEEWLSQCTSKTYSKMEILKSIMLPKNADNKIGIYEKYSFRKSMELALVSVAIVCEINRKNKIIKDMKIGLGAVAPIHMRAKNAEKLLIGKTLDQKSINNASQISVKEAKPITDFRASKNYREIIIEYLIKKALYNIM